MAADSLKAVSYPTDTSEEIDEPKRQRLVLTSNRYQWPAMFAR